MNKEKIRQIRLNFRIDIYLFFFCAVFFSSCYSAERRYVYSKPGTAYFEYNDTNPQFESGKPNKIIDGAGHYLFSLFAKLILWNWKICNHKITDETKEILISYIEDNNLTDVKVRFNQYAPIAEFERLRKNKNINAFARYTIGVYSLLIYTILPDRLFAGLIGGDYYNPYTNTINLYSNLPSVALHEGAHAKDTHMRKWKTAYSLSRIIPLVPLYQEARASSDTMSYLIENEEKVLQEEAYKLLSPAYGTYAGGELSGPITDNPAYALALVIPGHIYGRVKAHKLKKKRQGTDKKSESAEKKEKSPDKKF